MYYAFDFCLTIIFIGALFYPLPSIEHFIWPSPWCLLADICNHTWIPECGQDNLSLRLFLDECDMFEFNCDYQADYEIVNYSECFKIPHGGCPTVKCPSKPTCKNHLFHRMGDHMVVITQIATRPLHLHDIDNPPPGIPRRMLSGRRRYTTLSQKRIIRHYQRSKTHTSRKINTRQSKLRSTETTTLRSNLISSTTMKSTKLSNSARTVVLRRETILKNGKKYVRLIKGIV